ncbi:formylglycine-generating sulfatase enzyme [Desulfosporosinus acididurans]|uniref:Formylglycine-generating sulfatase enzyme n=1 Tax=Desulfosporosinus acididurans TaxID=476652 RepID=A0A0J1IPU7_9FIRM|nr:SUMF1/EgtB/PvdO family nonheme iron enzyme [Desulfosporosinus acididurans]KLU66721.1 formylglycine-generating sulfatase enzyme [Desulfosporosinus acididurans]
MNTTVIFDNSGKPGMMVRVPKFKYSDVISGGREVTCSAFIIDGVEVPEIFISKFQNIIVNGKAYSLPFQKPTVSLTFDQAKEACESKGKGWHLITNAEWAAIALWCKKNGTLPRGNNYGGSDYSHRDEKGICFDDCKVLTGSGPDTWSHDHTPDGIFDLNGNVWEWVGGLRLLDGEIQIIPDNNAAKHIDQSKTSHEWQPIKVDGKTFKYTEDENGLKVTTEKPEGWNGCKFSNLGADVEIPDVLKELALYPSDNADLTEYIFADADGERLPYRGGNWGYGSSAGVFSLFLYNPRSIVNTNIGFRSAFVQIPEI